MSISGWKLILEELGLGEPVNHPFCGGGHSYRINNKPEQNQPLGGYKYRFLGMYNKPERVKLAESVYDISGASVVCSAEKKKVIYVARHNVAFLM